jgi:hypothetical protein
MWKSRSDRSPRKSDTGLAAARIRHRGQDPGRLVEGQVDKAGLGRDALAVDPDHLVVGIDAGTEPADGLAVHLDPAGADELLAVPAATHPGLGQDLLQPDPARDVGQRVPVLVLEVVVRPSRSGVLILDVLNVLRQERREIG